MANKIGDILLLFSCLYLLMIYNSLYFNVIFSSTNESFSHIYSIYNNNSSGHFIANHGKMEYIFNNIIGTSLIDTNNIKTFSITPFIVCILVIIASICKSAQAGFHF